MSVVDDFNAYRSKMNEVILSKDNLALKRFFALDQQMYREGALDVRTKELLGLVASMVLRCDDCISYHLQKCHEAGASTEMIYEVFAIANMVGGSICIPHTRRAAAFWEELLQKDGPGSKSGD
ncbi:MAG: carboxymuconolactone decarboxylase family protein [Saprospiraceae bacterium]|nr:carboxymuconolactone decarboxylase family protein [Saprospiraceae bacterium]